MVGIMDLLFELVCFLALGALSGFLSGMLGIGGGVIVVPGLVMIFRYLIPAVPHSAMMHVAAGTSLAAMVITAATSTYHHQKCGDIDWAMWQRLLLGGVGGAVLGAWVAGILSTRVLSIVFATVLVFIAVHIFIQARSKAQVSTQPEKLLNWLGCLLAGAVFGVFSGLLGVGGGVLIVPFMLLLHYPMHRIVGTSAAAIVPLAVVGAASFMVVGTLNHVVISHATGYVYWPAFAGVAFGSMLLASVGTKVGHHVNTRLLKQLFSLLLILVAIEMFVS